MGSRSRHVKWSHGCLDSNDGTIKINEGEISSETVNNAVYVQVISLYIHLLFPMSHKLCQ